MIAHADEAMTLTEMLEVGGLPGVLVSAPRPGHDSAAQTLVHLARSCKIATLVQQGELVHIQRPWDGTPVIEHMTKNASRGQMNPDGMKAHTALDRTGIVPDRGEVE